MLENSSPKFTYQIGFNTTAPKDREIDDVPDPIDAKTTAYQIEDFKFNYALWRKSGFIAIQNWIGKYITP